jgi:hypothetical protein
MDYIEYFGLLNSWAKWERVRRNDPLYKDLTEEGIAAKEQEIFGGN